MSRARAQVKDEWDVWGVSGLDSDQLYRVESFFQGKYGLSFVEEFEGYSRGRSEELGGRYFTGFQGTADINGKDLWMEVEGGERYDLNYWIDDHEVLTDIKDGINAILEPGEDEEDSAILEPVKIKEIEGDDITGIHVKNVEKGLQDIGEVSKTSRPGNGSCRIKILHPSIMDREEVSRDYFNQAFEFVGDGVYEVELYRPEEMPCTGIEGITGKVEVKPDSAAEGAYKINVHVPESSLAQKYLVERVWEFLVEV